MKERLMKKYNKIVILLKWVNKVKIENRIKIFDMIDIGGESTSPGRKEVQIEEEI